MRKIKLCYIITKLELGGAQLNTLELIKGLDKNRFEPILFTSCEGFLVEEVKKEAFCKAYFLPALKREINPIYDLIALISIIKCIRKENPDIVHTHSSKAGILGRWGAKFAGVKVIIHTVHGFPFHSRQNAVARFFYVLLERITALITTKIITVAKSDVEKGLKSGIGCLHKYATIPCAIDHKRFELKNNSNETIKANFGINKAARVVGMIACFKPQKAPLDFIEVCKCLSKRLPDTKFILVGDGILRQKIEANIKKYGLDDKIILAGWRRDVPDMLSIMDVFVLTSRWEGLPVTIIEAMYMGVPVVANCVGGVGELVKNRITGYVVRPGEIDDMAAKIYEILSNNKIHMMFSENAKASIDDNYFMQTMLQKTGKLYDELSR